MGRRIRAVKQLIRITQVYFSLHRTEQFLKAPLFHLRFATSPGDVQNMFHAPSGHQRIRYVAEGDSWASTTVWSPFTPVVRVPKWQSAPMNSGWTPPSVTFSR